MRTLATVAASWLAIAAPARAQQDSDGDGLPDFHETHKHLTDPANPDSDGDGIPDGDWGERREYTYSVRAVMDIMRPVNTDTLTDDYQDGRVLAEHDDHVRIEVILYPLNTVADGVVGVERWGGSDAALARYLAPGPTTNWDEPLVAALHAELRDKGIRLHELTDTAAAAALADHLMRRVTCEDSFTTFAVDFDRSGSIVIPEELRPHWESALAERGRTFEEQLNHELYGRGMFENRTTGTCTSTAIYLSTAIKAAGIPARSILCVPVTDGNDDDELALAEALTHHGVRKTVVRAHQRGRNMWTSHTFNEVHVGGRWTRLNYNRLGQNILDDQYLGLMVHVHTFDDHARAGLAAWGRRNRSDKNDVCGSLNPYSCVELSDQFGPYCTLDNPEVAPALSGLTITDAYWFDLQGDPPRLETTVHQPESAGHLLAVVEEETSFDDYNEFYEQVPKAVALVAPGHAAVSGFFARGFWVDSTRGLRDFYIYFPQEEFEKVVPGVQYRLAPQAAEAGPAWNVAEDLRVSRPER